MKCFQVQLSCEVKWRYYFYFIDVDKLGFGGSLIYKEDKAESRGSVYAST